jgi:hypothetical protein
MAKIKLKPVIGSGKTVSNLDGRRGGGGGISLPMAPTLISNGDGFYFTIINNDPRTPQSWTVYSDGVLYNLQDWGVNLTQNAIDANWSATITIDGLESPKSASVYS